MDADTPDTLLAEAQAERIERATAPWSSLLCELDDIQAALLIGTCMALAAIAEPYTDPPPPTIH